MARDHGHTHLIVFVHVCGYYLRVATNQGTISINTVCTCMFLGSTCVHYALIFIHTCIYMYSVLLVITPHACARGEAIVFVYRHCWHKNCLISKTWLHIMLRIIWQGRKYFVLLATHMDTTHKLCTSSSCAQPVLPIQHHTFAMAARPWV